MDFYLSPFCLRRLSRSQNDRDESESCMLKWTSDRNLTLSLNRIKSTMTPSQSYDKTKLLNYWKWSHVICRRSLKRHWNRGRLSALPAKQLVPGERSAAPLCEFRTNVCWMCEHGTNFTTVHLPSEERLCFTLYIRLYLFSTVKKEKGPVQRFNVLTWLLNIVL